VELEPGWAALAKANVALARRQGGTGQGRVITADATHLPASPTRQLRGREWLVLTSPPYGRTSHGRVEHRRGPLTRFANSYGPNDPTNLAHRSRSALLAGITEVLRQCVPLLTSPLSSFNDLLPGDLLDDTVAPDHHAILFDAWEADHVHFSYYSFGSSPISHVPHASQADMYWAGHPVNRYTFWRYKNIVEVSGRGASADFNGDGSSDVAFYQQSAGNWYADVSGSGGATLATGWGAGTAPLVGDFNGDGKADIAQYSHSGNWYTVVTGVGGQTLVTGWGIGNSNIPFVGDFNADGKSDVGYYNPTTGGWYWYDPASGGHTIITGWGAGSGKAPFVGDFNAGGKSDVGYYDSAVGGWYWYDPTSGGHTVITGWGASAIPLNAPTMALYNLAVGLPAASTT
jgi:hypothetical protein